CRPDPHQAHRVWSLNRDCVNCRCTARHYSAGRAIGRPRIHWPRVCDLRAWRPRQLAGQPHRRDVARGHGKPHHDLLWPVLGARGRLRISTAHARLPAGGTVRTVNQVNTLQFTLVSVLVGAAIYVAGHLIGVGYIFFAAYTILQFVVLSTAWNILGGYCGYVNFGSAAFFALGAYTTVFFYKFHPLPIPVLIVLGAIVSGIVGLGMGYLTLRLRGAFFAIATLAMAVVLQ